MQTFDKSLIGASQAFRSVMNKIPLLSLCDATVLVTGETGTGKDLFARSIHYHSARQGKAFVPVNCAALPDHLVENELFGHAKGAFTDAGAEQKGLLAEANGGTVFLDEINSLSLLAQGKLLRFLQDREYRPIGSTRAQVADVRVIAATNADLKKEVEAKRFRPDLYHRLNVLSLSIPPLRERPEDISLLTQHFLNMYGEQYGRGEIRCFGEALHKLVAYDWPGNVRELQGVIQRAVILTSSAVLSPEDIDLPSTDEGLPIGTGEFQIAKSQVIEQFERAYLTEILVRHQGNVSQAARTAGTERRCFQRLLRKYGLDRRAFQQEA